MLLYFFLLLRVISWFESQKCMIKLLWLSTRTLQCLLRAYLYIFFTCTFSSPCSAFIRLLFSFHYAYLISNCCFSITCQKVINGVGWPDDRNGLSPILYDTAPVFIYTNQLLCHCVFICSNFLLMVGLLHAMAFMVLLLIDWVIWNNKPLPLPYHAVTH